MHYTLTVSQYGEHIFSTAPQSLMSKSQARRCYYLLDKAFDRDVGFKVDIVYWEKTGTVVSPDELKNDD